MLGTKKREFAAGTPGKPRRIEECAEWQEALKIKARLASELQRLVAENQACYTSAVDAATYEEKEQASRIEALASAYLDNAKPQVSVRSPTPAEQRRACEIANERHAKTIERLRVELAERLYRESGWEQLHIEARQRLTKAIIEAKTAFDAEAQLATEMHKAGALLSPMFGGRLWLNVSACGALPGALRTMNLRAFRLCNSNLLK
jgi:hypothetical protein